MPGMALQTDIVAVAAKLKTVRFVAIAARYARLKHPALDERAVLIDLALDLAVREIKVFIEQRNAIIVADGLAVDVVSVNLTTTRMAARAELDFVFRGPRRASPGIAGKGID